LTVFTTLIARDWDDESIRKGPVGDIGCGLAVYSIGYALVVGQAAMYVLTPTPPLDKAERAIRASDARLLLQVVASHPELLKDIVISSKLLGEAAGNGNLEITTALLDMGVQANTDQSSVLEHVGSVAVLELLLSRGASADEFDLARYGSRVFVHLPPVEVMEALLNHRSKLDPNDTGLFSQIQRKIRRPKRPYTV
jgi:hypothetical protein